MAEIFGAGSTGVWVAAVVAAGSLTTVGAMAELRKRRPDAYRGACPIVACGFATVALVFAGVALGLLHSNLAAMRTYPSGAAGWLDASGGAIVWALLGGAVFVGTAICYECFVQSPRHGSAGIWLVWAVTSGLIAVFVFMQCTLTGSPLLDPASVNHHAEGAWAPCLRGTWPHGAAMAVTAFVSVGIGSTWRSIGPTSEVRVILAERAEPVTGFRQFDAPSAPGSP